MVSNDISESEGHAVRVPRQIRASAQGHSAQGHRDRFIQADNATPDNRSQRHSNIKTRLLTNSWIVKMMAEHANHTT